MQQNIILINILRSYATYIKLLESLYSYMAAYKEERCPLNGWPPHKMCSYSKRPYFTIIDFNEIDKMIYLPDKVIFIEAARPR